ncbi:MAG: biotin--[acetyl-CoA-carboxylase] ligase, partial [Acidimicrobiia bacterium]|nr:biotin--[acetyl-CoA-carboxylase] ligase [Acidimicrobiia bacterium]
TQDYARTEYQALANGTPVLVVARAQDAGRGRMGREWWSAPRAMLASVALEAPPSNVLTLIPLAAGVAAHDAIEHELGIETELKWPNDVLIGASKAGGVLSELKEGVLVVGAGINLWWPDAPVGASALVEDDPGEGVAAEIAAAWAERMLVAIADLPNSFDRMRYSELCSTIGMDISWRPDGLGRAIAVDQDGALVVATSDGSIVLRSDEVSHVRPATIPSD